MPADFEQNFFHRGDTGEAFKNLKPLVANNEDGDEGPDMLVFQMYKMPPEKKPGKKKTSKLTPEEKIKLVDIENACKDIVAGKYNNHHSFGSGSGSEEFLDKVNDIFNKYAKKISSGKDNSAQVKWDPEAKEYRLEYNIETAEKKQEEKKETKAPAQKKKPAGTSKKQTKTTEQGKKETKAPIQKKKPRRTSTKEDNTQTQKITDQKKNEDIFIRTEYDKKISSFKTDIEMLSDYSKFDDLQTFENMWETALKNYDDILQLIYKAPAKKRAYWRGVLARDMLSIRENMPIGFENSIDDRGNFNRTEFRSKMTAVEQAVEDINSLEIIMNEIIASPPGESEKKKNEAIVILDRLRANESALEFLLLPRYGENGEGLATAREVAGLDPSTAYTPQQYLDIFTRILQDETVRENIFGKLEQFRARNPMATQTLMTSTRETNTSNGMENRLTYDLIAKLSLIGIESKNPNLLSDEKLKNILDAPGPEQMVPGLHYMLFSDSDLYRRISEENADMQVAIINTIASVILSQRYSATQWENRYSVCTARLSKLANIPSEANLVTDMLNRNYYGLDRGEIRQRSPWDYERLQYLYYPISSLSSFAYSMPTPVTPFSVNIVPRVYERQELQQPYDANYAFDRAAWNWYINYINRMPTSSMRDINYRENWIGLQLDSQNLLAAIVEIDQQLAISEQKFETSSVSGHLMAGNKGTEDVSGGSGIGVDAAAQVEGKKHGQLARGEVLYENKKGRASKYDLNEYNVYSQDEKVKKYAEIQATNVDALWTHISNAFVLWRNERESGLEGTGEEIAKVGGIEDEKRWHRFIAELYTTFPLAKDGTMIATINSYGNTYRPTEVGGGGEQRSDGRYRVDIFAKKGGVWVHEISEKDSDELLRMQMGDGEVLEDKIEHHFGQIYAEHGFVATAAAESLESKKQLNPGPIEGSRLGALFIIQPKGKNYAVGGDVTVSGDAAVLGAIKSGDYVFEAGYKIFDENSLPVIAPYNTYANAEYAYRRQTYTSSSGLPQTSENKINIADMSLMLIDEYRAQVFGGWGDEGDVFSGADLRSKNAHASGFFHFDPGGHLGDAVISVGGKTKHVDLGLVSLENVDLVANAVRGENQLPGMQIPGDNISFGTSFDLGGGIANGGGRMTIFGSVSDNPLLTTPFEQYYNQNIVSEATSLVNDIANISPGQILNIQTHDELYRNFMQRSKNLAYRIVQADPTNALYNNSLASTSVGYRSSNSDWIFTNQYLKDGGILSSGLMNFNDRVAFVGAIPIKSKTEDANTSDAYKYILGTKIRTSDRSAMHAFVGYMDNDKLQTSLGFAIKDVAGLSWNMGYRKGKVENYLLHLTVGPEKYMGIMNIGGASDVESQIGGKYTFAELSMRMKLSSALYLLGGYRTMSVLNDWSLNNANNPLTQTVKLYGMAPDSFNMDQGFFSFKYKYGDVIFDLTGQIENVRGRDSPIDFYVGGGIKVYK